MASKQLSNPNFTPLEIGEHPSTTLVLHKNAMQVVTSSSSRRRDKPVDQEYAGTFDRNDAQAEVNEMYASAALNDHYQDQRLEDQEDMGEDSDLEEEENLDEPSNNHYTSCSETSSDSQQDSSGAVLSRAVPAKHVLQSPVLSSQNSTKESCQTIREIFESRVKLDKKTSASRALQTQPQEPVLISQTANIEDLVETVRALGVEIASLHAENKSLHDKVDSIESLVSSKIDTSNAGIMMILKWIDAQNATDNASHPTKISPTRAHHKNVASNEVENLQNGPRSKTSRSAQSTTTHAPARHVGSSVIRCNQCVLTFATLQDHRDHLKSARHASLRTDNTGYHSAHSTNTPPGVGPHNLGSPPKKLTKCTRCQERFDTGRALREHLRVSNHLIPGSRMAREHADSDRKTRRGKRGRANRGPPRGRRVSPSEGSATDSEPLIDL